MIMSSNIISSERDQSFIGLLFYLYESAQAAQ